MRPTKLFLWTVLTLTGPVLKLTGQTLLQETQIAAPALTTGPAVRVLGPNLKVEYAVLGDGLRLNTTTTPWRIEVVFPPATPAPAPTPTMIDLKHETVVLMSQGGGLWNWSQPHLPGKLLYGVTRNGLVMTQGIDYQLAGQSVQFVPAAQSSPSDLVVGRFVYPVMSPTPTASVENQGAPVLAATHPFTRIDGHQIGAGTEQVTSPQPEQMKRDVVLRVDTNQRFPPRGALIPINADVARDRKMATFTCGDVHTNPSIIAPELITPVGMIGRTHTFQLAGLGTEPDNTTKFSSWQVMKYMTTLEEIQCPPVL